MPRELPLEACRHNIDRPSEKYILCTTYRFLNFDFPTSKCVYVHKQFWRVTHKHTHTHTHTGGRGGDIVPEGQPTGDGPSPTTTNCARPTSCAHPAAQGRGGRLEPAQVRTRTRPRGPPCPGGWPSPPSGPPHIHIFTHSLTHTHTHTARHAASTHASARARAHTHSHTAQHSRAHTHKHKHNRTLTHTHTHIRTNVIA